MQDVRRPFSSVVNTIHAHAVLRRTGREALLNPPHPKDSRASAKDAEIILPVLHEAIIGTPPNRRIRTLYMENNTQRDKRRIEEEETIAKIQAIVEKINKIIPGFVERIKTEDLKDIPKNPLQVPISPDCAEILWLAKLHSACTEFGDKPTFIEAAEMILQIMAAAKSCDQPEFIAELVQMILRMIMEANPGDSSSQ
jgi:hypothetical protein